MIRLPGVCIDCRTPVVYNGWGWHEWHSGIIGYRVGRPHSCVASPDPKAHNASVGQAAPQPHDPAGLPLASVEPGRITLA